MSLVPYKVTAIKKTDPTGNNVLPMASVSIIKSGGGYAQLWDDEAGTIARGNPFQVDANGERQVWLNGGEYNVSVAGGQSWDIKLTGGSDILSIENVAALSTFTPVAGQVYYLKEYNAGTGIGGGELVGADTGVDDGGVVFACAGGKFLKRINLGYFISPAFWGDKSDGTASSAAWQSAIDFAETLGAGAGQQTAGGAVIGAGWGRFRFDDGLVLKEDVEIDFGKSEIELYNPGNSMAVTAGQTAAFRVGYDDATQIGDTYIRGGRFMLREENAIAFAVQNANGPVFKDINLRMFGDGQVGFLIQGNETPVGPYYGVLDNIRIFGNADPAAGQTGILFKGTSYDGGGSNGVNRWVINNIRHVAAVGIGMDCENLHGQSMDNINFEACYDTAVRFNFRPTDHEGTVTTGGSQDQLIDTSFTASGNSNVSSVVVLTGANAGLSGNVASTSSNTIVFEESFPYQFSMGDTYELYFSKARDITLTNVTLETANTFVDFRPGSRSCKVSPIFRTQGAADYVFKRGHEDMSNTVARRYDTFVFEGEIGTDETVWLSPVHVSSTRGGYILPETGWVDAVFATGAVRGVGTAGLITIDTFAGGVDQSLPLLLTEFRPNRGSRVRRSLQNNQLVNALSQTIKVRAVSDAALLATESLRVVVYVAY